MRFLQTEWHRHERDRNAWQIERAEMKSRIGKLEGDGRTSKRLQESLGKHVKLLENALKKEREKAKALIANQQPGNRNSDDEEAKKVAAIDLKRAYCSCCRCSSLIMSYIAHPPKPHNSFLKEEQDDPAIPELKQDIERDKSRVYLGKCIQEVTYHVVPLTSSHTQYAEDQDQILQSHHYGNNHQQPPQPSLEEVYVQQRHKQQPPSLGVLSPPPLPNHQPPPIPRVSEVPPLSRGSQQLDQVAIASRGLSERQVPQPNVPSTAMGMRNSAHSAFGFPPSEDPIEKIPQNYDGFNRPIAQGNEDGTRTSEEPESADADGWDFDDLPDEAPKDSPHIDFPPSQRPDTDIFPNANNMILKSPTRGGPGPHRRKSSLSRRRPSDGSHEVRELSNSQADINAKGDHSTFRVRFALRGHLDVVRSVIFTGGGSPSEPEICTSGDDGVIKRWIIPAIYEPYNGGAGPVDLDIPSYFTHRGHSGAVLSLAASPVSQNFSNGGRAVGDGWVFSGGQDASVRVWERGRVDPKATLDGHTDAVWTVCVLPGHSGSILGDQCISHGGQDRVLLASGAADGTILIWAVSTPPQLSSQHTASRRSAGGSRRANSVSSGSNFPSSPQPSMATSRPFHYSLVHRIERTGHPSPTCINPLSTSGDTFVVSFTDASVLVYGTRTGEELIGMASLETYDGTPATAVNAVAATTIGLEGNSGFDPGRSISKNDDVVRNASGSGSGVEGTVLSGHEDRYIRFFDANSGMSSPSPLSLHDLSQSGA